MVYFISLVLFFLGKLLFSGFLRFKVIMNVAKMTSNTSTELIKRNRKMKIWCRVGIKISFHQRINHKRKKH